MEPISGRRWLMVLLVVLFSVFPGADQAAPTHVVEIAPQALKVPVPLVKQTTDYTCGPASLVAILRYYGLNSSEQKVMRQARTSTREGTPPPALVRVAREHGLKAEVLTGMTIPRVTDYLDRGVPVILDIQAYGKHPDRYQTSWEDGHYVVAVGYDSRYILFMDPSLPNAWGFLTRDELLVRWHDYENVGPKKIQKYIRAGIPVWGGRVKRRVRGSFPVQHID